VKNREEAEGDAESVAIESTRCRAMLRQKLVKMQERQRLPYLPRQARQVAWLSLELVAERLQGQRLMWMRRRRGGEISGTAPIRVRNTFWILLC